MAITEDRMIPPGILDLLESRLEDIIETESDTENVEPDVSGGLPPRTKFGYGTPKIDSYIMRDEDGTAYVCGRYLPYLWGDDWDKLHPKDADGLHYPIETIEKWMVNSRVEAWARRDVNFPEPRLAGNMFSESAFYAANTHVGEELLEIYDLAACSIYLPIYRFPWHDCAMFSALDWNAFFSFLFEEPDFAKSCQKRAFEHEGYLIAKQEC